MKKVQFKLTLVLVLAISFVVNAQKGKSSFKEEFKVKPDVTIDVNTRYTDIEIETWDRNEVVVEAFMKVEGKDITQEEKEEFYKKWEFEAFGNTSKISIKSKSNNYIDIHAFDFSNPDYEFFYNNGQSKIIIPDVSISGLDILDSMDFEMPELPPMPELPELPGLHFEMPELPDLPPMPTKFDFEAYKKDKNYLEKWKKENKDIISKNAKIKVGKNSLSIDDDNSTFRWNITSEGQDWMADELKEKLEKSRIAREKAYIKRQEAYKKRQIDFAKRAEEMAKRHEERAESRKLALVKRQETMEKRRKEMKSLIKNRERVKVKRLIKIKAPKDAKFNMNVKYGSMSFPK